jgi:hypothetical protein
MTVILEPIYIQRLTYFPPCNLEESTSSSLSLHSHRIDHHHCDPRPKITVVGHIVTSNALVCGKMVSTSERHVPPVETPSEPTEDVDGRIQSVEAVRGPTVKHWSRRPHPMWAVAIGACITLVGSMCGPGSMELYFDLVCLVHPPKEAGPDMSCKTL